MPLSAVWSIVSKVQDGVSTKLKLDRQYAGLFNCNRLGEISWAIDVAAAQNSDVI